MRPPIASAGCFGEKGPTPNPGRGLRFPARRLHNRNSPQPHPNAAVQNRSLGACRNAPWSGHDEAIASWGVSLLRERPGPARPWTCGPVARAGTTCGTGCCLTPQSCAFRQFCGIYLFMLFNDYGKTHLKSGPDGIIMQNKPKGTLLLPPAGLSAAVSASRYRALAKSNGKNCLLTNGPHPSRFGR